MEYLHRRAEESVEVVADWTTLRKFRQELGGEGGTVMISAGGYDLDDPFEVVEKRDTDAVAYGRYVLRQFTPMLMSDGLFLTRTCREGSG